MVRGRKVTARPSYVPSWSATSALDGHWFVHNAADTHSHLRDVTGSRFSCVFEFRIFLLMLLVNPPQRGETSRSKEGIISRLILVFCVPTLFSKG